MRKIKKLTIFMLPLLFQATLVQAWNEEDCKQAGGVYLSSPIQCLCEPIELRISIDPSIEKCSHLLNSIQDQTDSISSAVKMTNSENCNSIIGPTHLKKVELPNLKQEVVNTLKSKFSAVIESDKIKLNFKGQDLVLHYKFDDYDKKYVFGIMKKNSSSDDLAVNFFNESNECLNLKIYLEKREGHIDWITSALDCGLPKKGGGTFLLEFATEFSQTMGLSSVTLKDSSQILCEKNKRKTSFMLLHLLEKGQPWYESKGFVPKILKTAEKAREENIIELRKFSVDTIIKQIPTLKETLASTGKSTLSEALSVLWKNDCTQYVTVTDVLFPPATRSRNPPIKDLDDLYQNATKQKEFIKKF